MTTVRVEALTPLMFRDARPFASGGEESRARSLTLPAPSTIAGLLRTFVGSQLGWDWRDRSAVEAAYSIWITGYHFERHTADGTVAVAPAPRTAIHHRSPSDSLAVMRLNPAPLPEGAGHDGPAGLLPLAVTEDVKPMPGDAMWRWPDLDAWLADRDVLPEPVPEPRPDERVQIAVDPVRGAAADQMLFTAQYRAWDHGDNADAGAYARWSLVASFASPDVPDMPNGSAVAHFGGERRPVVICTGIDGAHPAPSPQLREALTSSTRVSMQLLTPALFDAGWLPGWAVDPARLHTCLAGARLVSAAVGRSETVSGWSYEVGRRGPKATRWAAPAGSTYFFELTRPLSEDDVTDVWFSSVCDRDRDRSDGYGIAVWGVWS